MKRDEAADSYMPEALLNDRREQLEKHPTPTLRVFTDSGNPWLMYAKFGGGEQSTDGTLLEIYYRGLVKREYVDDDGEIKTGVTMGHFILRIEGESLEQLAQYLGKQVLPKLEVGHNQNREYPYKVTRITLEPYTPVVLDGGEVD